MPSANSHPTYAVMVVEAIKENGAKKVSRQGILKFITSKYGLEANRANLLAKKAIKQLLEDKEIMMANVAGRKGAGSYKLPSKAAMMEKSKVVASAKKVAPSKEKATKGKALKSGGKKVATSKGKAGPAITTSTAAKKATQKKPKQQAK